MKFVVQVLLIFLVGCNSSNTTTNDNNKTTESTSDSLMHEVLKQHDLGMAKANKITEAKKRIQHALDSIAQLPYDVQKKSTQYQRGLDSAFNWLTVVDGYMETWMNEFNMDSLKDNKEEQVKYLESERIKISHVNEEMIASLQKADSLLKR